MREQANGERMKRTHNQNDKQQQSTHGEQTSPPDMIAGSPESRFEAEQPRSSGTVSSLLHIGQTARAASLLHLQQTHGNQYVRRLIGELRNKSRDSHQNASSTVQRAEIVDYAKDAYKHFKKLKEADKNQEAGEWTEPADETALHAKEALFAAKLAAEKAQEAWKDTPEAADKAKQIAEGIEKASKLVETGEKGFKGVVTVVEIDEIIEAIKTLNEISDLQNDPRSGQAFDNLFTVTGKLVVNHVPKELQGEFGILAHFNDYGGFFTNVRRGLAEHVPQLTSEGEGKEKFTLEPGEAALKTLEEVGPDVDRKYTRAIQTVVSIVGEERLSEPKRAYEQFRTAYTHLLALNEKTGGVLGWRRLTGKKPDPAVLIAMEPVAKEAAEALRALALAFIPLSPDRSTSLPLDADFAMIRRYEGADADQ